MPEVLGRVCGKNQIFYKEWLAQHPEFCCPLYGMTMEWYNGTDIEAPDYQCGVMIPLSE